MDEVAPSDPAPAPAPIADRWMSEPLPPDPSRREVTTPPECAGLPGTDDELALTPRLDVEAEVLAQRVAGTFTADTPTYERIRRDLTSIRARVPALANVRRMRHSTSVSLIVDASTYASMDAGEYTAWDCLHARYGWQNPELRSRRGSHYASGDVVGRYDMAVIVGLYDQLPGVTRAVRGGRTAGPSVCAARDPDGTFHYVFDDASGDCPSGCIVHHRYYFVSEPTGAITFKDEHSDEQRTERPDWVARYAHGGRCF